jgi:hypothetical protein
VSVHVRQWLRVALIFGALAAAPVAAHIKTLTGHLIDIVGQSDLVVIGVVTEPASSSASGDELTIDVGATILGELEGKTLRARTSARLAAFERQVVFLKREPFGYRCVQPSGTRFAATPEDDADYRRAVQAVAAALRLPREQQIEPLRAALIPALRAASAPLRYHAALDLSSLTHGGHELTAAERVQVEAVRSAPDVDPNLRPILDALLMEARKPAVPENTRANAP